MAATKRELLYIADPMCSWCWGFSPVISALRTRFAEELEFSLIVGGLRVGTKERLPEHFKQQVLHHWHEVNKATGQPFCFDFNLPEDFRYDTEPSCRASVVVRTLKPESAFGFFDALHEAFYAENRDVTNPDILAEIAEGFGVDRTLFLETFEAKETKRATYDDFARSYGFGVQGFPTAILQDERGAALLTVGYQHIGQVAPLVEKWLAQGQESPAS